MLPGVVPFPPEFAKRYRAKGYWQDKTLAAEFSVVFEKYKDKTALIDGDRTYTYGDIDRLTDNLALNLLELGLKPLDRVVPTLPNIAEFVLLYFALQKIGAIPIAALVTHRYAEISQFVQLSGASTCVYPERQGDFEFEPMIQRIRGESATLRYCIDLPMLQELIEQPANLPQRKLEQIKVAPTDPCVFQLSGGTTGIPKLIPRTHNDYAYNSKTAAPVCGVTADSILLLALPIAHNLPLACPGIQGYFFQGGKVVLSP
ncbi:MAG TPA: AMP-binding protein, partial [Burkholderiales bacterium]|nr:AMP-binding protein [Burkholderiales bacterium]